MTSPDPWSAAFISLFSAIIHSGKPRLCQLATGLQWSLSVVAPVEGNGDATQREIEMNRLLFTVALLGWTGSALAQTAAAATAPVTREEVYAELVRSKADGSYEKLHREYMDVADYIVSAQSRAKVAVQLKQARKDGTDDSRHQQQARIEIQARSPERDGRL